MQNYGMDVLGDCIPYIDMIYSERGPKWNIPIKELVCSAKGIVQKEVR